MRFWLSLIHKKTRNSPTMSAIKVHRFEAGLGVEQDNYYKSPSA